MSATVLPELVAESIEMAQRLVRLSAQEGLDPVEAEYILASGLAAIQRVPKLWPIARAQIGSGMTGPRAHEFLARLLDVLDKNLALAGTMKEPARVFRQELGRAPEAAVFPAAAETRLMA